jgi:hypothetical protein
MAIVFAGCDLDTLLEAEDPFTVPAEQARDTAGLSALFAGVRSQFMRAYGGVQNTEGGIVIMSGLMADELYSSDNFGDRRAIDRRDIFYDDSYAAADHGFKFLQRTRAEALNAVEIYENSSRAGSPEHAEMYSFAGYAVVLLAENYCSGIPLSRISAEGLEFGEQLTSEQLYEAALDFFDAALALNGAGAQQQALARVGKARALQDLDRHTEAATVAAMVPNSFGFFDIEYLEGAFSTPNPVHNLINEEHRFSASWQEGTLNRGLPFGEASLSDPRVGIDPDSVGSNSGVVPTYLQLMYPSANASIPLASALEARLIEIEAALAKGASGAYLPLLNALRDAYDLDPLPDPGNANARVDQFFAERAYFLYLTGHRLSDLRRLIRQYGRTQQSVFPTGVNKFGESYGSDVVLPLPFEEINNPNYEGCLNIDA